VTDQASDLKQLLVDIFEDSIVEPKERDALAAFTKSMSPEDSLKVFQQFLREKWGEAMEDDVLTGAEIRLLGHIVAELNLEAEHLPMQARMALKDAL
jgi:hypothetical protein